MSVDEALEHGRLLFARECRFVVGAAGLDQVPAGALPEVAFAGRSNVGKSSLINALLGRRGLARTSNTPGRTQQINFYLLDGRLMLADLPGYGYAKAPEALVRRWTGLVNRYLKGRAQLRRTCLLVDARRGVRDSDRAMMTMLDGAAQSYQVVLTKCDKLKPTALTGLVEATGAAVAGRPAAHPEVVATSSETGLGIADLRSCLAAFAPSSKSDAIDAADD